jgi:thiazole synthase
MPSPDPIGAKTLYPDMYETLRATEVLAKEGFKPMVYCVDDPCGSHPRP